MKWTERELARALHVVLAHKHLVFVPNCNWTGHEADLLVVRRDLRLIDVEIKVTRSDLKADRHKEKWLKPQDWRRWGEPEKPREPRAHPPQIWKHYYAVPADVWKPELAEDIQSISGVLLIKDWGTTPWMTIWRQAKPNREATKIDMEDLCHIAKLTSDRMWNAYDEVDQHRRDQAGRDASLPSPEISEPEADQLLTRENAAS